MNDVSMKLNYKLDEINFNNRLMKKEVFISIINKFFQNNDYLYVQSKHIDGKINDQYIFGKIGLVDSYKIINNEVIFNVSIIREDLYNIYKNINFYVSTCCIADQNKSDEHYEYSDKAKLVYLFLTNERC